MANNLNDLVNATNRSLAGTTQGLSDVGRAAGVASAKVGEYEGSWEKVGSTANTSLSLISAAIKDTNPGMSSMISSVQKLIPNLVELGNAAKKTGSLMKAMTSSAGILTLITLLTTIITDFDNIAESVGVSTDKIEEFKTKAGNALQKVSGFVGGLGNMIIQSVVSPIKGAINAFGILKDKGLSGAKEAAKAIGEGFYKGSIFNSAENFKKGQETVDGWVEGVRSRKKKASDVSKEVGEDAGKAFADSLLKSAIEALDANERKLNERMSLLASQAKEILADIEEETKELSDEIDAYTKSVTDGIIAEVMAPLEAAKNAEEAEKKVHDARIERNKEFLDSSTKLFGSIASSLSDNIQSELESGKITESQYKKKMAAAKAFQVASIVGEAASGIQSIWSAFAKEKIANAEAGLYATPAATAALNAKSLASAILQTGTIVSTAAAGIASVNSGSLSSSGSISAAASPSVGATPTVSQTYQLNQSYSDSLLEEMNSSIKSQQVVLVVDDVTKVQNTSTRVQAQASF